MNIKAALLSLLFVVWSVASMAQTQQQRLEKHVYFMAADSLNGRGAGSADARKVADYIEREFRQMGLKPLWDDYRLYFAFPNGVMNLSMTPKVLPNNPDTLAFYSTVYRDVVAVIEGCDPVLKNEYIVIGGHYDHLGVKNGKVYNGADDNASGAAAVIEVARQLMQHRGELRRSVIICAFDAEEIGLVGSKALSEKMDKCGIIGNVKMMMSVDMVGWLRQGKHLSLTGTATIKNGKRILDDVAKQVGINIATSGLESNPLGATDTDPFARKGSPTLHVTTGLKSPYHKPEDDADLIDYKGLSLVTDYLSALTLRMASTEKMDATGKISPKHGGKKGLLEVAPVIGFNSNNIYIPNSMFTCGSKIGFIGGISTRWNFTKKLGLEVDGLYDYARMPYPDENDIFGSGVIYRQQSVLVPAQLKLRVLEISGLEFHLGFGGYYGYRFKGTLPQGDQSVEIPNQHEYGIAWSIEQRMSNISFDFSFYYQFNDLFVPQPQSVIPATKRRMFTFTLGWYIN